MLVTSEIFGAIGSTNRNGLINLNEMTNSNDNKFSEKKCANLFSENL